MFDQAMRELVQEEVQRQNKGFIRRLVAAIRSIEEEETGAKRGPGRPPGRRMSPEERKRISEAQKARWAARQEPTPDAYLTPK